MNTMKVGLVGLSAALVAVGFAAPGIAGGNKYSDSTTVRDCGDGDTVTLVGPLKLWPPNHKMVNEPITATDSDGAGAVTLTITPTVTDAAGGDGGAKHDPDFNASTTDGKSLVATGDGSATAGLQLRAERSGKGDGRTYLVNWVAEFDDKSCSSSTAEDDNVNNDPFVITVPHDMRGGADWK